MLQSVLALGSIGNIRQIVTSEDCTFPALIWQNRHASSRWRCDTPTARTAHKEIAPKLPLTGGFRLRLKHYFIILRTLSANDSLSRLAPPNAGMRSASVARVCELIFEFRFLANLSKKYYTLACSREIRRIGKRGKDPKLPDIDLGCIPPVSSSRQARGECPPMPSD